MPRVRAHQPRLFALCHGGTIAGANGVGQQSAAHYSESFAGHRPVEPLITGRVDVDGVPDAFEALASPQQHAKIIVEPWR